MLGEEVVRGPVVWPKSCCAVAQVTCSLTTERWLLFFLTYMFLFFKHFDLKKHIFQKQNFANCWVVRNWFAIKNSNLKLLKFRQKLKTPKLLHDAVCWWPTNWKRNLKPVIPFLKRTAFKHVNMGWLELECIWFSSLVDLPIPFVTWCPWVHFVFVTRTDVARARAANQRYFHVFFLGWIGIQQHFSSWYGFGMVFDGFCVCLKFNYYVFFSLDSLKSTSISWSYCFFFWFLLLDKKVADNFQRSVGSSWVE